jgi:hypothetical protein
MQAVTHQSIELRAYELWEEAGRPFGRSDEFWSLASSEFAMNGAAPKKAKKAAAPKSKAATSSKSKAVAEPAAKPKKKAAAKKS